MRGAVVILADGVGGQGDGEVASRLAVETALETFRQAPPGLPAGALVWQMFNAANVAVYDAGMKKRGGSEGRMATTLTISLYRNNEVTIGHVGDCRVYAARQGRLSRITNDHSYAGVQLKLGLVSVQDVMSSPLRSVLTRTVGQDPMIRVDTHTVTVNAGDYVMQCSDGLYCFVTEGEIYETVTKMPGEEACRRLVEMAVRRGGDDNLSVQIVRVNAVERVTYYRGLPIYQKVQDPSMGVEAQVGQLLDDRYEITDVISRSGMASIFKATDLKSGRTVALKVPFMQFESDPGFYTRFKREEEIGRKLNHPYILHIEEADYEKSRPYIVMEYLEGQTLGHLMRSVHPLPVGDALKIAVRICEALHYMHVHEVIHRDMKPDNVMICNDGSIRIMDFGIAKVEGQRRLTFGGFQPAMGTPDYMAPEQVKGKRGDARTDIYCLGAILYEMVTGVAPFEGANPFIIMNARLSGDPVAPRKRQPEIPAGVEEIILHAMARDPGDRYPNALAMKAELDAPEKVEITGRADRLVAPAPWQSRWRRSRLVILAVVVPLVIFLLFFILSHLNVQWK